MIESLVRLLSDKENNRSVFTETRRRRGVTSTFLYRLFSFQPTIYLYCFISRYDYREMDSIWATKNQM